MVRRGCIAIESVPGREVSNRGDRKTADGFRVGRRLVRSNLNIIEFSLGEVVDNKKGRINTELGLKARRRAKTLSMVSDSEQMK